MIAKIWKDPVWSKVISAVILTIAGGVITYFGGLWPKGKAIFSFICSFLTAKTAIYNWLIIALIIPFVFLLIVIIFYLREAVKGKGNFLSYKEYNTDNFDKLKWIWKYGSDGFIYDVVSLCPKCDFQIIPRFASAFHAAPRYEFRCEECGYNGGVFDGDYKEYEQKIKLRIQKNLRTGEWKRKVMAQNEPNV